MKGDPTALAALLAKLNEPSRKDFATSCGTTVKVLEGLADSKDPNPSARLAFAIERESCKLAKYLDLPVVTARRLCGAND